MAVSQAHPCFLTAPLLAAKRVDVCRRLDCVAALHGVHVRLLVGAHQALTRPLAAASRLHSRPHLAPRAPNASGLVAMALSALPASSTPVVPSARAGAVPMTGNAPPHLCTSMPRVQLPPRPPAFSAAPASPKMSMTPRTTGGLPGINGTPPAGLQHVGLAGLRV